jgi:hypothetical protein
MALVSVMIGGAFGFVAALIASFCGAPALFSLAIWSGFGLISSALVLILAHIPRFSAQRRLAAQKA